DANVPRPQPVPEGLCMQVMVIGATGLIGSAIVAQLSAAGHGVIGVSRRPPDVLPASDVRWLPVDLAEMLTAERWRPHLAGVDAVVNCAGILQDAPGESTRKIHADAI